MRVKHWNIATIDEDLSRSLMGSLGLSSLACRVLAARNDGADPATLQQEMTEQVVFESPFLIKDMDLAVERIHQAVEQGERIAIYGDYDCDGITSTVLLTHYFQSIGGDVFHYIPSRESEGYGMNIKAIDQLASKGTQLIVTVDNGISSHQEVAYAAQLGIDVVITDHHTPRETLPSAVAVVNPHRADCPSRFKDYAGVGVAFQLVCAMEDTDPWELLDFYGDLVTIGTIADLVPLVGENRAIVKYGVQLLSETTREGILALMAVGGLSAPLTTESVSFGISPRINAAGRMDQVEQAVELLLTEDPQKAEEIAQQLQTLNLQRRGIEEKVLEEIDQLLKAQPEKLLERVLLVHGTDWHQGVLGIVASRLTDRYGKPSIVFSVDENGVAKGSGRSLEGFSLIEAITACSQRLTHFGGHTLAAGLTISMDHLEEFSAQMQQFAKEHYLLMPVPSYQIDTQITLADLTVDNIRSLEILSPYGSGNPSPLFVLCNLTLMGINPTADQKHMRLKFSDDQREVTAIYFRMSPSRFPYKLGDRLDTVVSVDLNEWNGSLQVSVKIQDLRPSGLPEKEGIASAERYLCHKRGEYGQRCEKPQLLPNREEQAVVYRYLQKHKGYQYGSVALWEQLVGEQLDLARLQITLDAFEEGGLISRADGAITLIPQKAKVDLNNTPTLQQLG